MPEDSLLTGIGMGSTLPLNGIGTSPTFNSTNNCPLIALSHSLLLGALLVPQQPRQSLSPDLGARSFLLTATNAVSR